MSYTATLNLTLSIVGGGVNEQSVPIAAWQNTNSPALRTQQTLNSGDNYIDPPQTPQTASQVAIVILPAGFTVKQKGVNADTGYTLGTNASFLIIPVGTTNGGDGKAGSFVLNANGQCVVTIWWL